MPKLKPKRRPKYADPSDLKCLTDLEVREVVWWLEHGRMVTDLANEYRVSRQTIWNIKKAFVKQPGESIAMRPSNL